MCDFNEKTTKLSCFFFNQLKSSLIITLNF